MKSILNYLLFTSLSIALSLTAPLGPCSNGRAVLTTAFPASGGQCRIPAPVATAANPVYRASINQALYDSGSSCGSCFEVTGPLGVITVVIIDVCPATNTNCGGDRANFVIEQAGFNQIINTTSASSDASVIYDLGFRLVTCPYADSTSINAYIPSGTKSSYFQVSFFNSRFPITAVVIKNPTDKSYEQLVRVTNSGIWQWNQESGGPLLGFPVQFSLVSNATNQVLFYTVQSGWNYTSDNTITFTGTQFVDVVNSNTTCPQAVPPALIYDNGVVGYGWNAVSSSYGVEYVNLTYPGSKFTGVTYCVQVGYYSYKGFQVSRDGGFNALYYQNLTFSVYTDQTSAIALLVYLTANSGSLATSGQTVQITNTPQTFTLNVTTLSDGISQINALAFQVNQNVNGPIQVFFSNLTWGLNAVNPQTEVPPVASTGTLVLNTTGDNGSTSGGTTVYTYTTGGFSFSDSEAPGATTTTASSNTNQASSSSPSATSSTSKTAGTSSTGSVTSTSSIHVLSASVVVLAVAMLSL